MCVSVIDEWIKAGKEAWQLLEPVDGFHANQVRKNVARNLHQNEHDYRLLSYNFSTKIFYKLFKTIKLVC